MMRTKKGHCGSRRHQRAAFILSSSVNRFIEECLSHLETLLPVYAYYDARTDRVRGLSRRPACTKDMRYGQLVYVSLRVILTESRSACSLTVSSRALSSTSFKARRESVSAAPPAADPAGLHD